MAERLQFKYIRQGVFAEVGECYVDVEDPTDNEEIAEKLKGRTFSRIVAQVRDTDKEDWSFAPAQ